MKKIKASTLRMVVILAVLVIIALGYFSLMGIGSWSALGWDIFAVICPLGYLESLIAGNTFFSRALVSFVFVVAAIIVLGRVFCAWICPVPLFKRWVPGSKKREKARKAEAEQAALESAEHSGGLEASSAMAGQREGLEAAFAEEGGSERSEADLKAVSAKSNAFKLDSRFAVLGGALASAAIFGFPVFCLICPVGLTFATVFLVLRLFSFGELTWSLIAIPVVLVIEVVFLRKWCSKICPLGALISLISGANKTLRPTIDDNTCINCTTKGGSCRECAKACPEDIDIWRPAQSPTSLNNCTKCRECADACPVHAITFPFLPKSLGKKESGEQNSAQARDATEVLLSDDQPEQG